MKRLPLLLLYFCTLPLFAQTTYTSSFKTPAKIDSLMSYYQHSNNGTMKGYRIQLYYGNNQSQSKMEADKMKAEFLITFPQEGAYLDYEAPFWRLSVGDYRSFSDAKKECKTIATKLPQFAGNLIIIPNQIINLPPL